MNESAREELETLAERGEARGAAAVMDGARAARRRRARTRVVFALGALLVVGLVAAVVATRGGDNGHEIATQPTVDRDAAPPADEGPITLFLSDTVLPAAGADLVVVLRNRGGDSPTFGVSAFVERWDGGSWNDVTPIATCLDHWFCVGSMDAPDAVPAIGLPAPPDGYGQTEWVHVEGLDPGWYRLRKVANEEVIATGTFRVVEGDVRTVDFGDVTGDKLSISPAVVQPSCGRGACSIRLDLVLRGDTDPGRVETTLIDGARLDRWTGDVWQQVTQLDFSIEATIDWQKGPGQRMAALPPDLTPGAYRVIRTAPGGAALAGCFWVEQPS